MSRRYRRSRRRETEFDPIRVVAVLSILILFVAAVAIWYSVIPKTQPLPSANTGPVEKKETKTVHLNIVDADSFKPLMGAIVLIGLNEKHTGKDGRVTLEMEPSKPEGVTIRAAGYDEGFVFVDPRKSQNLIIGLFDPSKQWPMFGVNPQRTQNHEGIAIKPPFKIAWKMNLHALIEFPVSAVSGMVYVCNNSGRVFAIKARTGKLVWSYQTKGQFGCSPAIFDGRVYVGSLDNFMYCLDADNGKLVWKFGTKGEIESSPAVVGGRVFFGSKDGSLYSLDAETGKLKWVFKTGASIKGSPAIAGGRVFIGNYAFKVFAVSEKTGKLMWSFKSTDTFYSSPAVSKGSVYIGCTNGTMYCLSARTGKTRWSYPTGNWIYSSPAIYRRWVYFGSYDGKFYSLNAQTGGLNWKFDVGEKISGSPTVINGVIYFGTFGRKTYAIDAANGEKLWQFKDGVYSVAAAAGDKLYISGHHELFCLVK